MTENGTNLGSGTVGGLMAFLDWVVKKNYMTPAAISPLKSAARQVFLTVEDTDEVDGVDVRSLDRDEYFGRFAVNMQATGRLTPDSTRSYRARFTRALEMYEDYLTTGATPKAQPRNLTTRPKREKPAAKGVNGGAAADLAAPVEVPSASMISYPFPLESGEVANLRLPKKLMRADAQRLTTFINALSFEPQKELGRGSDPAPDA